MITLEMVAEAEAMYQGQVARREFPIRVTDPDSLAVWPGNYIDAEDLPPGVGDDAPIALMVDPSSVFVAFRGVVIVVTFHKSGGKTLCQWTRRRDAAPFTYEQAYNPITRRVTEVAESARKA